MIWKADRLVYVYSIGWYYADNLFFAVQLK